MSGIRGGELNEAMKAVRSMLAGRSPATGVLSVVRDFETDGGVI
jgi:hypothetical protein